MVFYQHEEPVKPDGFDEREDITDASQQRVGQMLQFYTGQQSYLLVELARSDQHLTAQETIHGSLKKQKAILLDSGQTKYRLDAALAQDVQLQKTYAKFLEAKAYRDMLQAIVKGIELKRDLCSREITRRASEK